MKNNYYWPETMIFCGAGSTASLGMPSTAGQGHMFKALAGVGFESFDLSERVHEAFNAESYESQIVQLLCCLGDELVSNLYRFTPDEDKASKVLFPGLDKESRYDLVRLLREIYDWDALKKIIKIVPIAKANNEGNFLRDLFNIIDLHIKDHQGFYTSNSDEIGFQKKQYKSFISAERLVNARNCMLMLINLGFYVTYQKTLKDSTKQRLFNEYFKFMEALTHINIKDAITACVATSTINRRFYLLPYSIFSTNYDPIWLWLTFCAQKNSNINVRKNGPYIGNPPRPVHLFNDFATYMGIREIGKSNSVAPRYPFNEAVVQRLNDEAHNPDRFIRVGKFYFPHGMCCMRECKNCGKMINAMGDDFQMLSESVLPNPIIPNFAKSKPRSESEKEAFAAGRPDAIECPFCGNVTYASDVPLIMQTGFKGSNPPYLEEIQREAKVAMENANHFVLFGYSFPADDIIWKTVVATRIARHRTEKPPLCTIVNGCGGENRWFIGKDIVKLQLEAKNNKDISIETVNTAIDVFGIDNVRVYAGGIPNFWTDYKGNLEDRIRDLLNPNWKSKPIYSGKRIKRITV